MLHYIAHVTGSPDATGDFKSQNFRGEPRWERNVADALHTNGRLVGTTLPGWKGVACGGTADVSIAHGADSYAYFAENCRFFINHYYSPPHPKPQAHIREQMAQVGPEKVLLTSGFESSGQYRQLRDLFPRNFAWLPVPAVVDVHREHDGFDQKTLLWANRTFIEMTDCYQDAARRLFTWVAEKMKQDPSLLFEVLSGVPVEEGLEPKMWSRDYFSGPMHDVRERVIVLPGMSWRDVGAVWARTKLCVHSPMMYGGPPFEAASWGIPTVGYPSTSPFHDEQERPKFPEYLGAELHDGAFLGHLERLFSDHAFYRMTGDAYREYTAKHNTFAGFVAYLDRLAERLGWV